jgi:hypothetical protein
MEGSMSMIKQNRRFHWLGSAAVAALALTAISVPMMPAKAQIGVQVGPFGVGVVGAPYYDYYGPGPYYGYYGYGPYWHHRYYGW